MQRWIEKVRRIEISRTKAMNDYADALKRAAAETDAA